MNEIKKFYSEYSDEINAKRLNSGFLLRKYAHEKQYNSVAKFVDEGETVLDAGCGQGALSVILAKKGALVTGTDISKPNIKAANKYVLKEGVLVNFEIADLEHQPFPDNSFDVVVCSHVLEHIPDFDAGLHELMRVARKKVVFAVPTILNGCSLVQVGGGQYYTKGPRSFFAFMVGGIKTVISFVSRSEGVDERYAGNDVPHVFRFPSVIDKKLKKYKYKLISKDASTLLIPYFEFLLPLSKILDNFSSTPFFRNLGYGTTFVVDVSKEK